MCTDEQYVLSLFTYLRRRLPLPPNAQTHDAVCTCPDHSYYCKFLFVLLLLEQCETRVLYITESLVSFHFYYFVRVGVVGVLTN